MTEEVKAVLAIFAALVSIIFGGRAIVMIRRKTFPLRESVMMQLGIIFNTIIGIPGAVLGYRAFAWVFIGIAAVGLVLMAIGYARLREQFRKEGTWQSHP